MTHNRKSLFNRASLAALVVAAYPHSVAAAPKVTIQKDFEVALVSIVINGTLASEAAELHRDHNGRFYASATQLREWRIKQIRLPQAGSGAAQLFSLDAIPGSHLSFDEEKQALTLDVPADRLEGTRISYAADLATDHLATGTGAYINYDANISAQKSGGMGAAGAIEAVIFTPRGVGTSTFVGRVDRSGTWLTRLDTGWTVDDPRHLRSWRFGDAIAPGGVRAAPFRFAGIQLSRDFSIEPGFVTMPLPALGGSADLPSVVDVYVNNVLVKKTAVPAGPFDIIDIPIVTGDGQVQLSVTDMLGRQQLLTQRYYQAGTQLRAGLDDYSYELGFLRKSYGLKNDDYGSLILSASQRHGFSDRVTGEAHVEATAERQQAGIGGWIAAAGIGQLGLSGAISNSSSGPGYSASVDLARNTRAMSLGLHGEVSSAGYETPSRLGGGKPPASVFQVFGSLPLQSGSLGLSYLHRNSRDGEDANLLSANWSWRLPGIGSLNLAGRTGLGEHRDAAVQLFLTAPLGSRRSASSAIGYDERGAFLAATLQRSVPLTDGIGYRLDGRTGVLPRANAQITVRTDFGDYDAQLTWLDGKTGVRLSTVGSVGIVNGSTFSSRRISQSFARVKVANYPDVRVYSDNHLIGRTGKDGTLLVPNLRSFERNAIRIESRDLPLDAEISTDTEVLKPFARHGVTLNFDAHPSNAALLKLLLVDGTSLPLGSKINIDGNPQTFVSARDGSVYLTGLTGQRRGTAEWTGGRCQFSVPVAFSAMTPSAVRCEASFR